MPRTKGYLETPSKEARQTTFLLAMKSSNIQNTLSVTELDTELTVRSQLHIRPRLLAGNREMPELESVAIGRSFNDIDFRSL